MCTIRLEHVLFKVNIKILFLWFVIFLSEISENIEQKTFWWNIRGTNIFECRIIHTGLLSTINPGSYLIFIKKVNGVKFDFVFTKKSQKTKFENRFSVMQCFFHLNENSVNLMRMN